MSNPNSPPFLNIPHINNSRIVFDEFVKIRCDELVYENGHHMNYYSLLTQTEAVNILATTPEGYYILTYEYRHPMRKVFLSSPGGYIDKGESPLDAAKRELREETGYTASSFEVVGKACPCPGIVSQTILFVKAVNAVKVSEPQFDPSEVIQTCIKSQQELKELTSQDGILDGILCAALYFHSLAQK